MGILDKLFGGRKPTPSEAEQKIGETISQRAAAEASLRDLARGRNEALRALDEVALEAIDNQIAAAKRKIELQDSARSQLEVVHAELLEERATLRAEIPAIERQAEALRKRIEAEYPAAAAALASLLLDYQAFLNARHSLYARAREIGEVVTISDPEAFRQSPPVWYVTYPNPDGDGVVEARADAAPRGLVRWVDGQPIPARDGVEVFPQPGPAVVSLMSIVKILPGLKPDEPPYFVNARGGLR